MSGGWNDSWEQNDGVPGVVYVLRNPFFRDGFYKIGQTRHSGAVRARSLNKKAGGAIPQAYECVYEKRVVDCGRAERRTFEKLHEFRRGNHFWQDGRQGGQEFFEVPLERAVAAIEQACDEIEFEHKEMLMRETAERQRRAEEQASARSKAAEAEAGEAETQSSYVYSWNKPKPGPSTGAVLAWICAAVFAGVLLMKSSKPQQQPRGALASPQLQPSTRVLADRNQVQPPQSNGADGMPMSVVPTMPGVQQSTVPFPPGGSATYFAGKADGAAQASSVRLYVPAVAQGRYAVLVIRMPQNDVYAQAYLEPNDLAELAMPEGRFRLVYTKGFEWLGTKLMFGPASEVKQYGNEFDVAKGSPVVRVELPMD